MAALIMNPDKLNLDPSRRKPFNDRLDPSVTESPILSNELILVFPKRLAELPTLNKLLIETELASSTELSVVNEEPKETDPIIDNLELARKNKASERLLHSEAAIPTLNTPLSC